MKLKIAIQKSGRLHEESLHLLKKCGISLNSATGQLKAEADNFPIEVFFLRDDDIPQYVEEAVADIGFVGENVFYEKNRKAKLIKRLGFGKCRLSLAYPKNKPLQRLQDLNGKRIATSYPFLLAKFLKQHQVRAEIHEISGSVEIAPSIGLADAICDLVSSGSTLLTNGLKEGELVLQSEAVIVANKTLSAAKQAILKKLTFRINALQQAQTNKYILLNAPNAKLEKICAILPGMKSPTILPLAQKGWSSVHSVVNENEFWDIIEELKTQGAQGILVVPIEKMIS